MGHGAWGIILFLFPFPFSPLQLPNPQFNYTQHTLFTNDAAQSKERSPFAQLIAAMSRDKTFGIFFTSTESVLVK